jgi:hypothetical protein
MRWLWALATGGWLVLVGCQDGCREAPERAQSPSTTSRAWPLRIAHARDVPARADHLVFARSLRDVLDGLSTGLDRIDSTDDPPLSSLRGISVETWSNSGLDLDASLVAFRLDDRWGAVVRLADRTRFASWLEEAGSRPNLEVRSDDAGGTTLVLEVADTTRTVRMRRRGDIVALLLGEGSAEDFDWWREGDDTPGWRADDRWRRLIATTTRPDSDVVAGFDAAGWLRERASEGRAGRLVTRFARQIGRVGIRARYRASRRRLILDVLTPGSPGAPTIVSGLGEPTGELPPLGGLVEPGVLAVLRLSVDAERLYGLVRSMLPAERRRELDRFWEESRRQLEIEGPERIADNFSGHVVVVVYGLQGDRLDWDEPGLGHRILEMQATREAILMPIRDRTLAERTLDAFTQLSRGRLSRQTAEHTVHYAWLQDGLLEWAFVLGDDHLLYVDSATAFDQAMIYERRGGSLSREMSALAPLLQPRRRSGLYLDVATFSDLLAGRGYDRVAPWLEPLESLLVIGRPDARPPSTRLELELAPP